MKLSFYAFGFLVCILLNQKAFSEDISIYFDKKDFHNEGKVHKDLILKAVIKNPYNYDLFCKTINGPEVEYVDENRNILKMHSSSINNIVVPANSNALEVELGIDFAKHLLTLNENPMINEIFDKGSFECGKAEKVKEFIYTLDDKRKCGENCQIVNVFRLDETTGNLIQSGLAKTISGDPKNFQGIHLNGTNDVAYIFNNENGINLQTLNINSKNGQLEDVGHPSLNFHDGPAVLNTIHSSLDDSYLDLFVIENKLDGKIKFLRAFINKDSGKIEKVEELNSISNPLREGDFKLLLKDFKLFTHLDKFSNNYFLFFVKPKVIKLGEHIASYTNDTKILIFNSKDLSGRPSNYNHPINFLPFYENFMTYRPKGHDDKSNYILMKNFKVKIRNTDKKIIDIYNRTLSGDEKVSQQTGFCELKSVYTYHTLTKDVESIVESIINEKDIAGNTKLMLAAQNGEIDLLNELLNKGADPNLQNNDGNCALGMAVQGNNSEVVKALLKTHPNLFLKDALGLTPCDKSLDSTFEIVKILKDQGAEFNSLNKEKLEGIISNNEIIIRRHPGKFKDMFPPDEAKKLVEEYEKLITELESAKQKLNYLFGP